MSESIYTEIGITVNKNDICLKKQFMLCLDFRPNNPFQDDFSTNKRDNIIESRLYEGKDMIFGYKDLDLEDGYHVCFLHENTLDQIAAIINVIFPNTYLQVINLFYSPSCEAYIEGILFDPKRMLLKKESVVEEFGRCGIPSYCKGTYLLDDGSELSPKEFRMYEKEYSEDDDMIGYTFTGEGRQNRKYEFSEIDKTFVQSIIEVSKENEYGELTALLIEKFNNK